MSETAASAKIVLVEDSPTGVRAGVAAGARVIGFSADRAPGDLISAGALDTVPAMTALLVALGLNPVAVA